MEVFNVKRRDIHTFDSFMDLKKPGFGGPASARMLKDAKGKFVNKDRKLQQFQNKVERHPAFSNEVWNPTYKAMGGDLVHKQEGGKNPYNYPDSYHNMGLPTVNVGKSAKTNEGFCFSDINEYIFESADINTECDCECSGDGECNCDENCNCND